MTKLQFSIFLIFASAVLFNSCTSDTPNPATIEIIIKAKYKDQTIIFNPENSYEYFDGSRIKFTRSEFFINNFKLTSNTGTVKNFGELKHVRFDEFQINSQKAEQGVKLIFKAFAEGNYDGISFDIGLTPNLNKTSPSDYKADHVLSNPDNYWSGWNSYIFARVEGNVQNANGKTALFAYHCGFDESFRVVEIKRPITVKDGQINTFIIEIDHHHFFGDSTKYLDIYSNPIIHESNNLIKTFMDQFSQSFK